MRALGVALVCTPNPLPQVEVYTVTYAQAEGVHMQAISPTCTALTSGLPGTVTSSSGSPSSLWVIESSCTRSLNLCVSQHTSTGTLCAAAIMATNAAPARLS